MREVQKSLDVTSGVIWRQLLTLCVPVLLSSLFQQTYALTNTWMVGRFAGKQALAAIQATVTLNDLVVGFSLGIGVGCGVVVSQYFGAHDSKKVSRAVHTALGIALAGGVSFSVLGLLFVERVLRAMGTPADILGQSLQYAHAYMSALVFSIVFNTGSALQRAVGDTRTPSLIVAGTCVVNVALDLVFVAWLQMGALGCGIATASSLAVGALVTLWQLTRTKEAWGVQLRSIRIDPSMAWLMVKTGLPLGVQTAVYAGSNIIIQSNINSFGSDAIAGWGLATRLEAPVWMISEALGSSVTTFAAQNFGARNIDRMRQGLRSSLLITLLIVGGVAALTVSACEACGYFFVDDPSVVGFSTLVIRYMGPFYLFYSLMDNFAGTIRGAGESFRPMLLTILGTCAFRLVWLLAFVPMNHTLEAVLLSYPVSWVLTAALFVTYYRFGHWLRHAEEHEAERALG